MNRPENRARILAGYCWEWEKKKRNDTGHYDIQIDDFKMSWNLGNSSTYAIDKESVNEVGCIHTSQGLEYDTTKSELNDICSEIMEFCRK